MRSYISNLVKECKEIHDIKRYDTIVKNGRYYRVIKVDEETITLKEAETLEELCRNFRKTFTLRKDEFVAKKYRKLNVAPVITYTLSQEEIERENCNDKIRNT